ncbi:N-carbamoyl-D-amino-acid hydrolase [Marinivivus vitaminiproducens]|uniref:N-carbamoyl-D-amino-acid hydrolase n=1 Tax=Marinivivus vitaminiproducens TaxID=3035935 RepID=UPI0027986594|nr:N-carbamoyl-D-amino-acid hydrolase [Geminicoccaceae bacterium SCSIO 64248]
MSRNVTIGAAQVGPILREHSRGEVVERLIALLRAGAAKGCDLVVFPELTLTTFFPRWFFQDESEADIFFETEMPNAATAPLFEEAKRLGVGFHLGYAELTVEDGRQRHFNTAILVDKTGAIVGKYRKVHVPGHSDDRPSYPYQHLEKKYFETGNLGFPVFRAFGGIVGMLICNDRRWPEAHRSLGLQGVEMVLVGYNTPRHAPATPHLDRLSEFHNHLSMQAGAYQNATWVIGVAKAGWEEGADLIGGSCIIAPTGEIMAQAVSQDDELIAFDCDLDLGRGLREHLFNFADHRQPQHYRRLVDQTGVILPPE